MQNEELIKALKEDAEWAHANEWETPITLGDHLDAAADALEAEEKRAKELEEAQGWIPVSERKPNEWQDVIMYHGKYGVQMAKFHDNRFWVGDGWYLCVAAWQPLPQPPQKGE